MQLPHDSARARKAHQGLARALPDADIGQPDATGIFEIAVDADDWEAAMDRVWNAVAATGADEHVTFAEHSDVPGHWRARDSDG